LWKREEEEVRLGRGWVVADRKKERERNLVARWRMSCVVLN